MIKLLVSPSSAHLHSFLPLRELGVCLLFLDRRLEHILPFRIYVLEVVQTFPYSRGRVSSVSAVIPYEMSLAALTLLSMGLRERTEKRRNG